MQDKFDELEQDIDEMRNEIDENKNLIDAVKSTLMEAMNVPTTISVPVNPETSSSIYSILSFPVSTSLFGATAATAANYGYFFIATRSCYVDSVSIVYKTAGTDGSAVTLQIESLTGTTALGSGTALLDTALSLKATAATVYNGALLLAGASGNKYVLNTGDRLALKLSGTPTSVDSLTVTIGIKLL